MLLSRRLYKKVIEDAVSLLQIVSELLALRFPLSMLNSMLVTLMKANYNRRQKYWGHYVISMFYLPRINDRATDNINFANIESGVGGMRF